MALCKPSDWGIQTDDPAQVTCEECKTLAAKWTRATALQRFEVAEVAYRSAYEDHAKKARAANDALEALNAKAREMGEARKEVVRLLNES